MNTYETDRMNAHREAREKRAAAKEEMRREVSRLLAEQGVAHEWPEQIEGDRILKNWIKVNGENVGLHLDRTRSYGIGNLVIRVGDSGSRSNFPIRKSGTFNYPKIVEALVARAKGIKRSREYEAKQMQDRREGNKARDEFCEETGIKPWEVIVKSSFDGEPTLTIKLKLTPDQMREALRRLGDLAPGKKD